MNKKAIIIVLIIIIIVGVVGFFVYDDMKHKNESAVAYKNLETAEVKHIKATLNLYYALKGEYPRNDTDLVEVIRKDSEKSGETLQKSINNLKDFNYSVRGDEQAYKFTYTDTSGNRQSIEGNYKEDFH